MGLDAAPGLDRRHPRHGGGPGDLLGLGRRAPRPRRGRHGGLRQLRPARGRALQGGRRPLGRRVHAPCAGNSAFDKHNNEVGTPITADVLKYHVIVGKKTMDALNTDQKTLNGGTLTAYRKFRKNWLDGAIIGLKSEGPSKSSNWPSDVECDNGIIHAIDTVLVPGAYAGER